ncbi:hypothetical protein [Gorillibacterium sp. sgz500922]|uniref:hypothetical protein n=1 Tax=Gorillibacterium sp. sgz500922 TaxID=3446694 RepID=UPI003F66EDF6
MTLEAAILLPFFLAFLLALHALLRLSIVEIKVQGAASETVKEVSTHYAPIDRLYAEAKQALGGTKTVQVLNSVIGQIQSARQAAIQAEEGAQNYAALIPEPLLELVEWERNSRMELEARGQAAADGIVQEYVDPVLNAAFKPIVWHYADNRVLQKDRFRITKVTLPDLNADKEPWFGVSVEYEYRLPIPFLTKTITIRKSAMERAWVGKRE